MLLDYYRGRARPFDFAQGKLQSCRKQRKIPHRADPAQLSRHPK
jgi:hypothetical protein